MNTANLSSRLAATIQATSPEALELFSQLLGAMAIASPGEAQEMWRTGKRNPDPKLRTEDEGMNKQPLKAITLHRPWAYAVAHLGKPVENRSWACPLAPGSLIAIHAGRKFDKQSADLIRLCGYECPPDEEQPTGIVAIARFMGNVTAMDSPWFFGPIGWQLENVVAIPPVACSGQQGLWNVPDDVLPAVRLAYGAALKGVAV